MTFENEFVDEQIVADQERRLHRLGWNFEGLQDERRAEERDKNGDEERFGELRDVGAVPHAGTRPLCGRGLVHGWRRLQRWRRSFDDGRVRKRSVVDLHSGLDWGLQAAPDPSRVRRSSRAARAASCSAFFLLRPCEAARRKFACQTSTSKVFWCCGPDSL